MKPRTQTILLCGLFLLFAQSDLLGAPAPGAPQQMASDLPPSERLVTALPATNALPVSAEAQALIEWPSVETLASQQARQDRSKTIPPLFRQPKIGDAKPIRLGARSPQAACKEAEQWIRRTLKPQWLPDDLAARLQPLQRLHMRDPAQLCRHLRQQRRLRFRSSKPEHHLGR